MYVQIFQQKHLKFANVEWRQRLPYTATTDNINRGQKTKLLLHYLSLGQGQKKLYKLDSYSHCWIAPEMKDLHCMQRILQQEVD